MGERFVTRGFTGRRDTAPGADGLSADDRRRRTPPGQYLTPDFPVLSAGPTPRIPLDRWSFRIDGLVREPVEWSWEQLLALPSRDWVVDISCVTKWTHLDMRWHGCFRSRVRARAAFDALVALFARLGHVEPTSRLPEVRLRRGARLEAFRGVPPEFPAAADAFLSGDSTDLLALLFDRLPRAFARAKPGRRRRGGAADPRRLRPEGRRPRASRASDDGTLRLRARGRADALIIAARHR